MRWIFALLFLCVAYSSPAAAGGAPKGCPSRAWCGCWLAQHFGIHDKGLWLARNWLKKGQPVARPAPGVIAIFARRKGGHVGIVTAVPGPGKIEVLSGNDGGAVRQRVRSTANVIGYRQL